VATGSAAAAERHFLAGERRVAAAAGDAACEAKVAARQAGPVLVIGGAGRALMP
jgi:hypothetical protein